MAWLLVSVYLQLDEQRRRPWRDTYDSESLDKVTKDLGNLFYNFIKRLAYVYVVYLTVSIWTLQAMPHDGRYFKRKIHYLTKRNKIFG